MKKICLYTIVLCIFFVGCTQKEKIVLDQIVKDYIENTFPDAEMQINDLGDYSDVSGDTEKVEVSEQEINDYIKVDLESYEELVELKKRKKVRKNDFVKVTIKVRKDGKVIGLHENKLIKVGSGKFHPEIETLLLGAKVGKTFHRNLKVPEDFEDKELAGEEETFSFTVHSINKMVVLQLNNQFVKKYYNLKNVEEYRKHVKNTIYEREKKDKKKRNIQSALRNTINKSKIAISEELLYNYGYKVVVAQNEQEATLYGLSMEEYREEMLKMTEEEFYDFCYEEARYEMSSVLVVGAIAAKENITVTKEESDIYYKEHYEDSSSSIDWQVRYLCLEEKVYDFLFKEMNIIS